MKFTKRVVIKYVLIHLAELVLMAGALALLVYLVDLPVWLAVVILVLWIIKDVALFPKVWRAYASQDSNPLSGLIGSEATVVSELDPVGYVRVNGELWRAESRDAGQPAKRGDRVRVVDIRGTTLIVEMLHRDALGLEPHPEPARAGNRHTRLSNRPSSVAAGGLPAAGEIQAQDE